MMRTGKTETAPPAADLSDTGPDCFCALSTDGIALHVGANAGRVLGIPVSSLLGKKFLDRIHVHDRVAVAKAIGDCAVTGAPTRAEFRLLPEPKRMDEPSAGWFEIRCIRMTRGADGAGFHALGVIRDIGSEHDLQERLQAARQRVDEINVAKARFLANMSHELRTPLNAILGFSEFLQSDVMKSLPAERHQEYVGLIHASARHLLQVVNDILDMSKMDAGKYEIFREPFPLGSAMRECIGITRAQAEQKNLQVILGEFDDLPEICADVRAVKQIVINLLSNAVKFTQPNGRVEVSARRSGRFVEIAVRDNGIGISSEHLGNLGTPFYQADSKYDRQYEGTGLGLSLVYGLVQLHGGVVDIDSKRNSGTTVTVSLPIDPVGHQPVPAVEEMHFVNPASRVVPAKSSMRGA